MSEDKSSTRWENTHAALGDFQSSVKTENSGHTFKNAAKAVLDKELKKFSELPNAYLLGEAAFGLASTGVIVGGMFAPLTEGLIKMATTGTSVIPAGSPEQTSAIALLAVVDLAVAGLTTETSIITFNRIKDGLSPNPIRPARPVSNTV